MTVAAATNDANAAAPSNSSSSTIQLSGHVGAVTSLAYNASGTMLASTSTTDRACFVWSVISRNVSMNYLAADDDNEHDDNANMMNSSTYQEYLLNEYCSQRSIAPSSLASCHGSFYVNTHALTSAHKNAILDCCWMNQRGSGSDQLLVTCGADRTVQLHDVLATKTIRSYKHDKVVNAVSSSPSADTSSHPLLASCSDDGTCKLWDARQRKPVASLVAPLSSGAADTAATIPLTAVALSESHVYTGGLDNLIVCWDLTMLSDQTITKPVYALTGHADTISGLALHPRGTHLLSNNMDATLRVWDVRPFVANTNRRLVQTYQGHKHSSDRGLLKCAWSCDGNLVSCGSADKLVHIWDAADLTTTVSDTDKELYVLPGHKGCVNAVAFHPQLPNVVASGSADHRVLVGELS
ncbi:hypothetical protein MPSEU_000396600 [Mayamaea pseudoterrestris]|nr:hypothetical protein MPSEU_000396600 [Mayamaea pseudoterrestris]